MCIDGGRKSAVRPPRTMVEVNLAVGAKADWGFLLLWKVLLEGKRYHHLTFLFRQVWGTYLVILNPVSRTAEGGRGKGSKEDIGEECGLRPHSLRDTSGAKVLC